MNINRTWRYFMLGAVLLLLVGVVCFSQYRRSITCMGVPILSEQQAAEFSPHKSPAPATMALTIDHHSAALDQEQSILYVTQAVDAETKAYQLAGQLRLSSGSYRLCFAPDPYFKKLQDAIQKGHTFALWAADQNNHYYEYQVVFTTLPVLTMGGEPNHTDEEGRTVYAGDFCLWSPNDPDYGRRSIKTAEVQWNVRGASSALLDKKPWKLSLKSKKGDNKGLSLLGLGADDDWILNPLNMDDTDLKELMMIRLWNALAAQTEFNHPMANGEYVEVVINGKYQGVHLLQRRIDRKYLELNTQDILLKGLHRYEFLTPQESLEIIHSPFGAEETYALAEGFCSQTDYSMVDPQNFIDVFLFLRFGSLSDNQGCKNMFYLLKNTPEGYRLMMIPWDTDMSFGVTWDNGFAYNYDISMQAIQWRTGLSAMREHHAGLTNKIGERWEALRADVLSEERIFSILDGLEQQLDRSGAPARDRARWGTQHAEQDTIGQLRRFITERLKMLDELHKTYKE